MSNSKIHKDDKEQLRSAQKRINWCNSHYLLIIAENEQDMRPSKRLWSIFLVIAILFVVHIITPTFGQQIPFNKWVWNHYPVQKIRYYMSDSVLEWLNTERPSQEEIMDKLGTDTDPFTPTRGSLTYWLKSPVLIGLDIYTLIIRFNEDGSFDSAFVVFSD